jgi:nucleoid-associated protein YgaU
MALILVYCSLSGVPPVCGRFAMAIPDLDTSASVEPLTAVRPLSGFLRLSLPGIVIFSFASFCAPKSYSQDVAEAARQERARKEAAQKKTKHVYTAEDLKRARILTPEDQAELEAKKNQPAPTTAQKSEEAVDGSAVAREDNPQSLPADVPLGDVARRYRREKESQQLQRSAEFHLPFADAPVLASPKPPVQPLRAPTVQPVPPRIVPNLPRMKRSPFERPTLLPPAPPRGLSSLPPGVRVAPSRPIAPAVPSARVKLNVVIVKPGDSLWKLAQKNLGKGLRWRDLLSYNPGLRDPNLIAAGSEIYVPVGASPLRTDTKFTVRAGDTLSSIALSQLGHASSWSCIAHANPEVRDANLIHEGQVLLLPAGCKL